MVQRAVRDQSPSMCFTSGKRRAAPHHGGGRSCLRLPSIYIYAADGRMRSAARRRILRRLKPTGLIERGAEIGVSVTLDSVACSWPDIVGVCVSSDARDARAATVVCPPGTPRLTRAALTE